MPQYPFVGFTGDTPILTATGYKPIEELKPGDMIQVQPETINPKPTMMNLAGGRTTEQMPFLSPTSLPGGSWASWLASRSSSNPGCQTCPNDGTPGHSVAPHR
jgi:hypothetical protein